MLARIARLWQMETDNVARHQEQDQPQPIQPSAALHSTTLFDLHVDASHALPPVMSALDAAPRPTRPRPL